MEEGFETFYSQGVFLADDNFELDLLLEKNIRDYYLPRRFSLRNLTSKLEEMQALNNLYFMMYYMF